MSDKKYRPIEYKVHLEPDLERFDCRGCVEVLLEIDPTFLPTVAAAGAATIELDSRDIAVKSCRVGVDRDREKQGDAESDCRLHPAAFSVYPVEQKLKVRLPEAVLKNLSETTDTDHRLTLAVDFISEINDAMAGLYRSRYVVEDGKTGYVAVTQFEEVDARRAFPCFDHPGEKAFFDIEIVTPAGAEAISVTSIEREEDAADGRRLVVFRRTPRMSTYLLFFGIGRFDSIEETREGRVVRALTPPGMAEYGRHGMEFARKSLEYCEEYTGVPYPIDKMDLIAVNEFAWGAMENYGAVLFRESTMLVYPGRTPKADFERITEIVAHEIAHMWFGNLVTPSEWKYVWLNESFATLFGKSIVDRYYPEWQVWDSEQMTTYGHALERDSYAATDPIELPGEGELLISAANAAILYQKGACVLRMLIDHMGEDAFRKSVRNFLEKYSFDCADSDDCWAAIQEVSDIPVAEMMHGWIHQAGYPLIIVEHAGNGAGGRLKIRQERFNYSAAEEFAWTVPLSIRFLSDDECGRNAGLESDAAAGESKRVLLDSEQIEIDLPAGATAWKVNAGQKGFYRVRYVNGDSGTAPNFIGPFIRDHVLDAYDRFGVQDDLFAMTKRGDISLEEYLGFLERWFSEEMEYLPLASILAHLEYAYLVVPVSAAVIRETAGAFIDMALEQTGCDVAADESRNCTALRSAAFECGLTVGYDPVNNYLMDRFAVYRRGGTVHPDIFQYVVAAGAATGTVDAEFFKERVLAQETNESERVSLLLACGGFSDPEVTFGLLDWALDAVAPNKVHYPVTRAGVNPAAIPRLWKWFAGRFDRLQSLHPNIFERILIASVALGGLERKDETVVWLSEYRETEGAPRRLVDLTIERLEVAFNFRNRNPS